MKVTKVADYLGEVDAEGLVPVYDITVEDLHLYYANGLLVSNSKRVSLLDVNAMMAHGALENLRDAGAIRGQRDEHWWLQFMQGFNPSSVKVPLVHEKFHNQLRAAGMHVKREGQQTHLMELTDQHIKEMAGDRFLRSGETVRFDKDLKPIAGGLFDPQLTGGHGGKLWSALKLTEPMPNPVMEEPLRRLLGLTQKQFEGALSGQHELTRFGSGPEALHKALDDIHLTRELGVARAQMHSASEAKRDEAVRRLHYLKGAIAKGIHPREWLLHSAPVLPPIFRPVALMSQSGLPLVADSNYLYKELYEANQNLADMKKELGDKAVGPERLALYHAFKAVTGLGDPIGKKTQEKGIKGILKNVFGSAPKFGCFDDATEILTENGWVVFSELVDGVRVGTLNQKTGAFEWQKPTGVFHWDYEGELFWFGTARGLDCVVTPNHRNWVRYRRGDSNGADDMESGWRIERAYVTAADTNRKWFRVAASTWVGHSKRPKFLPKTCKLCDFAAFVGWWTAEGWLGDRKRDSIQLCQAVKQEAKCKEIDRLVRSLGLRFSVGKYLRGSSYGKTVVWQWSVRSKELAAWLTKHVRTGAAGKKLSARVRDWDTPYLQEFFLAYLAGDGTRRYLPRRNGGGVTHKNHSSLLDCHQNAHTVSAMLAGDLQEIACKLGVVARLKWRPPQEESHQPLCRVNLAGSRFVVMEGQHNHKVIDYIGQVHCVSVPNGIVYVRRNGKPFFSGNTVQRKLLSSTVDNVGRAVITPNPNYDIDTVGLPENQAFDVYKRFIARRLKRQGMPLSQAMQHVADKSELARSILQEEMDQRPVYINRAPVLHKFGVLAFKPQLVKGDVMQISPLVVTGFNADFDGDQQYAHVICFISSKYLTAVSRTCVLSLDQLEEHRMTARFKTQACVETAGDFFAFHLEDFPHGKHLRTTAGQFGPIDWFAVPDGVKVLAVDAAGKCQLANVTVWSRHHDCPVQIVTLASGRQIFTDDDPRAVYGVAAGTLKLERARPADAVKHRFLVPRLARMQSLAPEELDVVPGTTAGSSRGNQLKYPVELTGCFGYLLGVLAGDGWATGNGKDVCVAATCDEIVDRLDRGWPKLFAGDSPVRHTEVSVSSYGESKRHTYSSVELNQLVASLIGSGAQYKHLPVWFLRGPLAFRTGLFAGLMDTDGSISIARAQGKKPQLMASYSSRSLRLCQEVRLLAATLSIRGRITASTTPAGEPFWMLSFSNIDISRWGGKWMAHPQKLANVRALTVEMTPAQARTDLVPISTSLARYACKLMPTPKNTTLWPVGQASVYAVCNKAARSGVLSRSTALQITRFAAVTELAKHEDWSLWQAIITNTDVTWDAVTAYEATTTRVTGYDLTVPGVETFVDIDGVVLSNTMQFHVPTSEEAVKEAYERMLPSRNLISPADFKTPVHAPVHEYLGGGYEASTANSGRRPRYFRSKEEVLAAHRRGEISYADPVVIMES